MDRNKSKKLKRSKTAALSSADVSKETRKLPRNREVLSLLLSQVSQLLTFLASAHQRHQHRLKILLGATTNPHSVLSKLEFLGLIEAASNKHFAAGGPDSTPLRQYINQRKFAAALAKFNTAKAALHYSNPKALDAAELHRCADTFQEFVAAEAAVIDIFRAFQSEVITSLEICEDKTDRKTDKDGAIRILLPRNLNVCRMAKLINDKSDAEGSQIAVARQFTDGDEKKARSLLRQLRRYPHLLARPQT